MRDLLPVPSPVLDPVAAWYVADILSGVAPPTNGSFGRIAYKTGTSYGYRDAWSIGFDGRTVIGVWAGRPDGAPVPGLSGIGTAAPILFEAFDRLGTPSVPLPAPPPGVLKATNASLPAPLKRFRNPDDNIVAADPSYSRALRRIEKEDADIILEIPAGSERNLVREGSQQLGISVDAINGTKAAIGGNYLQSILGDFCSELTINASMAPAANAGIINITYSTWFNPLAEYKYYIVPGILVLLLTMIGGFMSALNIVREKEAGTIEQINVTPIKKHHFILGKLIPFWVLGNIIFSIGLIVARVVYGIVPVGSLPVLYACISMYLLAILGFGLLISTFCETQQQAMLIMFFFMMIFILMGGLYTPIESMPGWAQVIAQFNPAGYLIEVIRMVVLKGSGFRDITPHLVKLGIFAIVLNGWAVFNYKKTS